MIPTGSRPVEPDRAWRALRSMDQPGYHYEFAAQAILVLARGLTLEARADHHPAVAQVVVVDAVILQVHVDRIGARARR